MNSDTCERLAAILCRHGFVEDEVAFLLNLAASPPAQTAGGAATPLSQVDESALPAKHACVHALGHRTFVGPVTPLGKGYRVEHHEVDGPHGEEAVTRTVVDVFAVHSVEYISDTDWADLLFSLEQSAAKDRERHRRETTMPEGYTPIVVEGDHGYRRPDGLEKTDSYWGRREVHLAAWRDKEVRAGLAKPGDALDAELDLSEGDIPSDATAEAPAAESNARDLDVGDLAEDPYLETNGFRWLFRLDEGYAWAVDASEIDYLSLMPWPPADGDDHLIVRRRGLKTLDEVRDAIAQLDAEMLDVEVEGQS